MACGASNVVPGGSVRYYLFLCGSSVTGGVSVVILCRVILVVSLCHSRVVQDYPRLL